MRFGCRLLIAVVSQVYPGNAEIWSGFPPPQTALVTVASGKKGTLGSMVQQWWGNVTVQNGGKSSLTGLDNRLEIWLYGGGHPSCHWGVDFVYAESSVIVPRGTVKEFQQEQEQVGEVGIWDASWQNQQNDCAPSEDSDQPGHPPSLIRVFAVRSMGS